MLVSTVMSTKKLRCVLQIAVSLAGLVVLGSSGAAVANAAPPPAQFTVVNGSIRNATGTPAPDSGKEAALWGNTSYATTTIEGSGRVIVGGVGDECDGWPTIRVTADGQRAGDVTVVSHTAYGTYTAGQLNLPSGSHQIRIEFLNDYAVSGRCDRNVALGFARMETPATGFAHPGVSVSKTQLDLIKAKVTAGQEPWKSAYAQLKSQRFASTSYVAHPVDVVKCANGGGRDYIAAHPERPELAEQGCEAQTEDADAALTQALIWYISGDTSYAQRAIAIMNAWSGTLTDIWFDQPRTEDGTQIYGNGKLQAAWTAETITRAAEIIRYGYTPASGQETFNVPRFSSMLTNVLLPLTIDNWTGGGGNWLMSTTDATIAIGVFTNDRAVFDNGIGDWRKHVPSTYYLTTDRPSQPQLAGSPIPPPGTIYDKSTTTAAQMKDYWEDATRYVNGLGQESCRDLSHYVMGLEGMSSAAETARIQGIDLWAEQQTRIVATLELNASYVNSLVAKNTTPANSVCPKPLDFGGTAYELGWEAAYHHYANLMGVSLPQTRAVVARNRPTKSSLHMTAATLLYGDVL